MACILTASCQNQVHHKCPIPKRKVRRPSSDKLCESLQPKPSSRIYRTSPLPLKATRHLPYDRARTDLCCKTARLRPNCITHRHLPTQLNGSLRSRSRQSLRLDQPKLQRSWAHAWVHLCWPWLNLLSFCEVCLPMRKLALLRSGTKYGSLHMRPA